MVIALHSQHSIMTKGFAWKIQIGIVIRTRYPQKVQAHIPVHDFMPNGAGSDRSNQPQGVRGLSVSGNVTRNDSIRVGDKHQNVHW